MKISDACRTFRAQATVFLYASILSFIKSVYTLQPVVQPVIQLVVQSAGRNVLNIHIINE